MPEDIKNIYKLILIASCPILHYGKINEWWWDSQEYVIGIADINGMCVNYSIKAK